MCQGSNSQPSSSSGTLDVNRAHYLKAGINSHVLNRFWMTVSDSRPMGLKTGTYCATDECTTNSSVAGLAISFLLSPKKQAKAPVVNGIFRPIFMRTNDHSMLIRLSHTKAQHKNIIGIKGHTSVETYYNRPTPCLPQPPGRKCSL